MYMSMFQGSKVGNINQTEKKHSLQLCTEQRKGQQPSNQVLYSTKGTMENLGTLVNKSVYPRARVSPFPGHITVARIIVEYITHITRVLKAAGAELCQNACGVVNEQKTFCSHQYSSESR